MGLDSFAVLLEKFLQDTISPDETTEFLKYVNNVKNQSLLKAVLTEKLDTQAYKGLYKQDMDEMFEKMLLKAELMENAVEVKPATRRIPLTRMAVAATLILAFAGIYALFMRDQPIRITSINKQPAAVEGERATNNKAVLTLADGTKIVLDSASSGSIAQQGSVKIIKLTDGQLAYSGSPADATAALYNTIATPKGGQYQLVLTDGTKVWLNAASSLRFPTRFSTTERVVELTGEGYFEIAPDKTAPFYVKANGMQVHALGTGFNVMAYDDEQDIRTTLEEGSVEVSISGHHQLLMPGEQAKWAYASDNLTKQKVEVSRVTAWKNGVFDFKGADLHTIMRQVSRWYDVEVKYQGNLEGIALSGIVSRKEDVSKLIEVIEATERVQFEKKGSVITVMPYVKK